MSYVRFRLEEAIQAAARIDSGQDPQDKFTGVGSELELQPQKADDGINSVEFTPDGKQLLMGTGCEGVKVLDVSSGEVKMMKENRGIGALAISCLRLRPTAYRTVYAAGISGYVFRMVLDKPAAGFEIAATEAHNQVTALDLSASGKLLATVGSDCCVRVYDCTSPSSLQKLHHFSGYHDLDPDCTEGHAMRLFAARFHPDSESLLLTAGWDNAVKLWDTRVAPASMDAENEEPMQHAVGAILGPHICSPYALDIRGQHILTASWVGRGALQIWDLRNPTEPFAQPTFDTHGDELLYAGRFANHGVVLAASSASHCVRAINVDRNESIGEMRMPHAVYAMDCALGGQRFAAASSDGTVKLGYLH